MKAKHFFIGVVGSVLACFSVLSLLLVYRLSRMQVVFEISLDLE